MYTFSSFAHPTYGTVRALVYEGKPWFVASDICRVLALPARKSTLDQLDSFDYAHVEASNGGGYILSRAGVYTLALESSKSYAKAFANWLSTEVVPSLAVNPDADVLLFSDEVTEKQSVRDEEVTESLPAPMIAQQESNLPQIFSHEEYGQLRTLLIDNEPWFVGGDVAAALGYSNVRDALSKHVDSDDKNTVAIRDGIKGNPNKTIINESGLYSLVLGSRKPQAKAFKRWITHEVIPSIRKHGAYMTKPVLQQVLNDPNSIIQLASTLLSEHQRAESLQKKVDEQNCIIADQTAEIEEMRPKVSYLDTILQNARTVPISIIAKDYGMSGVAMNKLLHELGIQYRFGKGPWLLYSRYAQEGYTASYLAENKDGAYISVQSNWTQKGRLFLYNTLKERRGLIPLIERESA